MPTAAINQMQFILRRRGSSRRRRRRRRAKEHKSAAAAAAEQQQPPIISPRSAPRGEMEENLFLCRRERERERVGRGGLL